jgi:hypothetical protein
MEPLYLTPLIVPPAMVAIIFDCTTVTATDEVAEVKAVLVVMQEIWVMQIQYA